MAKIAVIFGTSRPTTTGKTVAQWFTENSDFKDHTVELIDLKEEALPLVPEVTSPMMVENFEYETPQIKDWSEKIRGFDAFVFVVNEYNLGYSPIQKNAFDVLYHEWSGKPASVISYGSYDTSTAAEQFRVVLSAPKMNVLDKTVHISPSWQAVTEDSVDESSVSGDAQEVADELVAALTP